MILPTLTSMARFKKIVSVFLLPAFLFTNTAFADVAKNTTTNGPAKQVEIVTDPAKIVVPRDFGLVKSVFTGKDKRLIIHIQDAHCNFEAQTNITKILENLIKNYGLTLVSVEGADGFIDTTWFKAFPDEEVRKEVATYFMKKGEITGPEFLSITTDYPIKLFGAETRSYYIQNLNAFTSSYPLKEDTEKYFNQIKTVLNKLKNYVYSNELKDLDAKMQDYESKKLQFTDYVKFLENLAANHKIKLRQYENLFKLVSVLVYEKKIDFNVVDKERSSLIDDLTKKLPKETLTELVTKSLSFKMGKISSAEYYDYLRALALHNGFQLSKDYPNLFNYIIYNSVYSRIENEKLFKDIKNLEMAIKESLFTNDDQRTLDKLYRNIDILLGLVNIKLLNGDFDYYKEHKEGFSHECFADFINKMTARYGFAFEVDQPSDAIKENMPKLEDFYAIAVKRDKALLDNTLQAMNKENVQVAVLVTGGFHSEGIAKMLEQQNISYMVVCPNITKDVETPYIKILTNQRTPLEEILADTGATTEPKNTKSSMLAPYLITSAINKKDLEQLIRIRLDDDLLKWTSMSLSKWIPKERAYFESKHLPYNEAMALVRFNASVDKTIELYIGRKKPSAADVGRLKANAAQVKQLAASVIGKLLKPETTTNAPFIGIIEQQKDAYAQIAGKENREKGYRLSLARFYSFGLNLTDLMSDKVFTAEDKTIVGKLIAFGKGSVFRFWKEYSDDNKRNLLNQLKGLDIDKAEIIYQSSLVRKEPRPTAGLTLDNLTKPETYDLRKGDTDPANSKAKIDGEASIRRGELAILEVAGGSGTRLGSDKPKGTIDVRPVIDKPLFELRAKKIRALSDEYGKPVPWVIMTSDITHDYTEKFFADNLDKNGNYFGCVPKDWVIIVRQRVLPNFTDTGEYVITDSKDKILIGGYGHGDATDYVLSMKYNRELIDKLKSKFGIKYVMFVQVDNAFMPAATFLGHHIRSADKVQPGQEHLSKIVVDKTDPSEKVGMALMSPSSDVLVEYSQTEGDLAILPYLYVVDGERYTFFKDGKDVYHMWSIADFHELIRKDGYGALYALKFLSVDQLPEDMKFGKYDKNYLKHHAQLWSNLGNINALMLSLESFTDYQREELPPLIAKKDLQGYDPKTGKYIKVRLNKAESFVFEGFLRAKGTKGAHVITGRSAEVLDAEGREVGAGESGFAPIKNGIPPSAYTDNLLTAADILEHHDNLLLRAAGWSISRSARTQVTPAFSFFDGKYLPGKTGKGGKVDDNAQLYLSGKYTTVGDNFHLSANSVFILDLKDEYGAKAVMGKDVGINAKISFVIHGNGRLIIDDGVVLGTDAKYNVGDGKVLHITKDGPQGPSVQDEEGRSVAYAEARDVKPANGRKAPRGIIREEWMLTNIKDPLIHEAIDRTIEAKFASGEVERFDDQYVIRMLETFIDTNGLEEYLYPVLDDLLNGTNNAIEPGAKHQPRIHVVGEKVYEPLYTVLNKRKKAMGRPMAHVYGHPSDNGIFISKIPDTEPEITTILVLFELLKFLGIKNSTVRAFYEDILSTYEKNPEGIKNHLLENSIREDMLRQLAKHAKEAGKYLRSKDLITKLSMSNVGAVPGKAVAAPGQAMPEDSVQYASGYDGIDYSRPGYDPNKQYGLDDRQAVREAAEKIFTLIPKDRIQKAKILDCATGRGLIAEMAIKAGAGEVVALDSAPQMIAAARERISKLSRAKNVRFVQGDMFGLDKLFKNPDGTPEEFDYITVGNTLCFFSDDKRREFFETAKKHLKPGGQLIIQEGTRYEFFKGKNQEGNLTQGVSSDYRSIMRSYPENLQRAGYANIDITEVNEEDDEDLSPIIPDDEKAPIRMNTNVLITATRSAWLNPKDVPPEKRVVIMISGGESPGVNDYFALLAKKLAPYGYSVEAVRYGLDGVVTESREEFLKDKLVWIDEKQAWDIERMPGAFVGTARRSLDNPEEPNNMGYAVNNIKGYCKTVIVIGGNDHMAEAGKLSNALKKAGAGDICVLGFSKSIDYDAPGVYMIGADSSGRAARDIVKRAAAVPGSNKCVVVQIMGRKSGYLTAMAGNIANPTVVVAVPEWSYDYNTWKKDICRAVRDRMAQYGAATLVVSEGFNIPKETMDTLAESDPVLKRKIDALGKDAQGNVRLTDLEIGDFLREVIAQDLKEALNIPDENVIFENPGYSYRDLPPNLFDWTVADKVTDEAVRAITSENKAVIKRGGARVTVPRGVRNPEKIRARIGDLPDSRVTVDLSDFKIFSREELEAMNVLGLINPTKPLPDMAPFTREPGADIDAAANFIMSQSESAAGLRRLNLCVIARDEADEVIGALRSPDRQMSSAERWVRERRDKSRIYITSADANNWDLTKILDEFKDKKDKLGYGNIIISGKFAFSPKDPLIVKLSKTDAAFASIVENAKKDKGGKLVFGARLADLIVIALKLEKNISGVRKNILGESLNKLPRGESAGAQSPSQTGVKQARELPEGFRGTTPDGKPIYEWGKDGATGKDIIVYTQNPSIFFVFIGDKWVNYSGGTPWFGKRGEINRLISNFRVSAGDGFRGYLYSRRIIKAVRKSIARFTEDEQLELLRLASYILEYSNDSRETEAMFELIDTAGNFEEIKKDLSFAVQVKDVFRTGSLSNRALIYAISSVREMRKIIPDVEKQNISIKLALIFASKRMNPSRVLEKAMPKIVQICKTLQELDATIGGIGEIVTKIVDHPERYVDRDGISRFMVDIALMSKSPDDLLLNLRYLEAITLRASKEADFNGWAGQGEAREDIAKLILDARKIQGATGGFNLELHPEVLNRETDIVLIGTPQSIKIIPGSIKVTEKGIEGLYGAGQPGAGPEQGAITIGGKELTDSQKIEVNGKIRSDFESRKARLVETIDGIQIYEIPGLEELTYLVAHPGRGGDACDHKARRIYLSPSKVKLYKGFSDELKREFFAHEKAHIDNPDKGEEEVEKMASSFNVRMAFANKQIADIDNKINPKTSEGDLRSMIAALRDLNLWVNYAEVKDSEKSEYNKLLIARSELAKKISGILMQNYDKNKGLLDELLMQSVSDMQRHIDILVGKGKMTKTQGAATVKKAVGFLKEWLDPNNRIPDYIRQGTYRGMIEGRFGDLLYAYGFGWRQFGTAGIRNQAVNSEFKTLLGKELQEFAKDPHAPILTGPNMMNSVTLLQQVAALSKVMMGLKVKINETMGQGKSLRDAASVLGIEEEFAQNIIDSTVTIGYDSRLNGGYFGHLLASAFLLNGIKVNLFDNPSGVPAGASVAKGPSFFGELINDQRFAEFKNNIKGSAFGVLISASHSEAEYNGFKAFLGYFNVAPIPDVQASMLDI